MTNFIFMLCIKIAQSYTLCFMFGLKNTTLSQIKTLKARILRCINTFLCKYQQNFKKTFKHNAN